jgi:hypothetical protein
VLRAEVGGIVTFRNCFNDELEYDDFVEHHIIRPDENEPLLMSFLGNTVISGIWRSNEPRPDEDEDEDEPESGEGLLALRDRARARQPCGSLLPDEPCHIPRELGSDSDRRGARAFANSAAFASTVCRIPPRARFLSTLGNFYGPLSTITGHGRAASRE